MRFTLPVLCMHSYSFEVLQFGGAIPPPNGGEPSLGDPPWGGVMTLRGRLQGRCKVPGIKFSIDNEADVLFLDYLFCYILYTASYDALWIAAPYLLVGPRSGRKQPQVSPETPVWRHCLSLPQCAVYVCCLFPPPVIVCETIPSQCSHTACLKLQPEDHRHVCVSPSHMKVRK
jgi:hypothetical protein